MCQREPIVGSISRKRENFIAYPIFKRIWFGEGGADSLLIITTFKGVNRGHFHTICFNLKTMIIKYLTFSISIAFISCIVGMVFDGVLKKTAYYKKFSSLNLIESKRLNKQIGLRFFKWIVKNTPFKYFNQKLKLKAKIGIAELNRLRKEMTFSEMSHLIGFAFVTVFALVKFVNGNYLFSLIIMIVNILMNLYPALLQQENKRRIDRLIKNYR